MMLFALRGLAGRKLRTVLTALSIILGVAMVAGTFVLTDSITNAFDAIFASTYKNTDAVVTGKSSFKLSGDNGSTDPSFGESLLPKVKDLPDVAAALGGVQGDAHLIGKDGKAIVYGGAPNIGFSVDPDQPQFNSLTLVEGAWPKAGEVVVDKSTAGKEHFTVGQTIGIQARGEVVHFRISGIAKYGAVSSIGGATLAGFDLQTAQSLFDKVGKLDQIRIAKKSDVSQAQLLASVRSILPVGTQVRTGDAQATKDAEGVSSFLSFLQKFLLAFAGVALFVGSFVIANSLSITIAQRTREFATLRTLGASRRQVRLSVLVESLAIGTFASVTGLFLGLALAKGLFWLFTTLGFTLPNNGLPFEGRTIVISLLVGILVTVLASLRPAFRATRVPPIAAVREGSVLPPGRFARFRGIGAVLVAVLGFAGVLIGLFLAHGTAPVLVSMLVGALLVFIGVALFASQLVRPLAHAANPVARWTVFAFSVLVWPLWSLPFWLLRYGAWGPGRVVTRVVAFVGGAVLNCLLLVVVLAMWIRRAVTSWQPEWPADFPGVLTDRATTRVGSENSQRNPQRTASTAAALMIGLALVTLVAVLAAGIIKPFQDAVDELFTADYAITAQNNFDPIPPSAALAAAKTPAVETISSVRGGDGFVVESPGHGSAIQVTGVEPQISDVISLKWQAGSTSTIDNLGADGAVVSKAYAKDHKLHVGSPITLLSPAGGVLNLVLKGIFAPPTGGSPFGNVTISSSTFDQHWQEPLNIFTFVKMRGGVTDQNTKALKDSLETFPNAKAQTRKQFTDNQINGFKQVLNILYVLLALSVVVSVFGIVNTLVLTVYERTREIGMLRAIGMTRRQTRRMIRHESVITALIGAALGIVLGLILGGLLSARVKEIVFVVPWLQLVIFTIAAIVVGILAAIFPARRAARLNPLEALQYE